MNVRMTYALWLIFKINQSALDEYCLLLWAPRKLLSGLDSGGIMAIITQ